VVIELVKAVLILTLAPPKPPWDIRHCKIGPRRADDPPILVADARKAHKLLNWTPQRNLANIVSTAWNFMGANR
jgi:UDP-glucose 4-epimerase